MRYLALALMPEGSTDASFLWSIAYRTAFEILAYQSKLSVTIGETPCIFGRTNNQRRANLLCDNKGNFDLFILHSDASERQEGSALQHIHGEVSRLAAELCAFEAERLVPRITTREMESWALADVDAVARACGYEAWPRRLKVPWKGMHPERVADPKRALNLAIDELLGEGRRDRSVQIHAILNRVGESMDLSELERLNSYRTFRACLTQSLKFLRLID